MCVRCSTFHLFLTMVFFFWPLLPCGGPTTYGCEMDEMDKIYNCHARCMANTTNIQDDYEFLFKWLTYAGHPQCLNNISNDLVCNGDVSLTQNGTRVDPNHSVYVTNLHSFGCT